MAMSAVYTTIDGELLSESRGGASTLYVPDALGSLAEARDASGSKVYEAEYWAYGEVGGETGTNPSPWGYVGLLGYLRDSSSLLYVRARHYRPTLARWQTADPLWPDEGAYGYAKSQPVRKADAWGLMPTINDCPGKYGIYIDMAVRTLCRALSNSPSFGKCISKCAKDSNIGFDPVGCMKEWCNGGNVTCAVGKCGQADCASAKRGSAETDATSIYVQVCFARVAVAGVRFMDKLVGLLS